MDRIALTTISANTQTPHNALVGEASSRMFRWSVHQSRLPGYDLRHNPGAELCFKPSFYLTES
jgi:hypothetical protein